MFGKMEENGVSTSHVLSIRHYAHIQAKHAKKGLLVKTFHFNLLRTYANPSKSYQPTKHAY